MLLNGTTVHKAFKLPLSPTETTVASRPVSHPKSNLTKTASIIVWDEALMFPNAIDRYLRGLMRQPSKPMGRKVSITCGDFRQVLPVIKRAYRTMILESSIKCSTLWPMINKKILTLNVRLDQN